MARRAITIDEKIEKAEAAVAAAKAKYDTALDELEAQAVHAVNHILDRKDTICLDIMPAAIFTSPEAACVGPSEDRLKAQGMPFECRKAFHRVNGKALTMGETEGMLKLLSEPDAGRILGCHVYGNHGCIIENVA